MKPRPYWQATIIGCLVCAGLLYAFGVWKDEPPKETTIDMWVFISVWVTIVFIFDRYRLTRTKRN